MVHKFMKKFDESSNMPGLFHSVHGILAGAGTLVLACGTVETVSDGQNDASGIHQVDLLDGMSAAKRSKKVLVISELAE